MRALGWEVGAILRRGILAITGAALAVAGVTVLIVVAYREMVEAWGAELALPIVGASLLLIGAILLGVASRRRHSSHDGEEPRVPEAAGGHSLMSGRTIAAAEALIRRDPRTASTLAVAAGVLLGASPKVRACVYDLAQEMLRSLRSGQD